MKNIVKNVACCLSIINLSAFGSLDRHKDPHLDANNFLLTRHIDNHLPVRDVRNIIAGYMGTSELSSAMLAIRALLRQSGISKNTYGSLPIEMLPRILKFVGTKYVRSKQFKLLSSWGPTYWIVPYENDFLLASKHNARIQLLTKSISMGQTRTPTTSKTLVKNTHNSYLEGYTATAMLPYNKLATANWKDDTVINIWDISCCNACTQQLRGHTRTIIALTALPAQNKLASGSTDKTVRLWNLDDGSCTHTLQQEGYPTSFAVRGDNRLASLSSYGLVNGQASIKIWNTESGKCLYNIPIAVIPSSNLIDLSHDRLVATVCPNNTIEIFNVESGEMVNRLNHHPQLANICALSGDNVAITLKDLTLHIWNIESNRYLQSISLSDTLDAISDLTHLPGGNLLVSSNFNQLILLYKHILNCNHLLSTKDKDDDDTAPSSSSTTADK